MRRSQDPPHATLMLNLHSLRSGRTLAKALPLLALGAAPLVTAQRSQGRRAPSPGSVARVAWSEDGKQVLFTNQGMRYRLDLETLERETVGTADRSARGARGPSRRRGDAGASTGKYVGRPSRGRQYTQVDSPDGAWEAHYRDWNVVLVQKESKEEVAVTTEGDADVHFGTASGVYGEELNQTRPMWWTSSNVN